jgi:hypothetical protein
MVDGWLMASWLAAKELVLSESSPKENEAPDDESLDHPQSAGMEINTSEKCLETT